MLLLSAAQGSPRPFLATLYLATPYLADARLPRTRPIPSLPLLLVVAAAAAAAAVVVASVASERVPGGGAASRRRIARQRLAKAGGGVAAGVSVPSATARRRRRRGRRRRSARPPPHVPPPPQACLLQPRRSSPLTLTHPLPPSLTHSHTTHARKNTQAADTWPLSCSHGTDGGGGATGASPGYAPCLDELTCGDEPTVGGSFPAAAAIAGTVSGCLLLWCGRCRGNNTHTHI